MSITSEIKTAINRSISHNEIVHLTIDGDSGDALEAVSLLTDCETDSVFYDREGVDELDVWGFDPDAPAGEMLWRLNVRFAE